MLPEFTSCDEVRAVLGVSHIELADAVLLLPTYVQLLEDDLEAVGAGLVTAFRTASAIAPASRTSAQKRLYDITRLFSSYSVAKQLLTSLPYFAEQRLSDGRAEKERIADPFTVTKEGVLSGLNDLKFRLSAAFAAVSGGTALARTTRIFAGSTGLAVDPVTNS